MQAVLNADETHLRFRVDASQGALDVLFDGHRVWSVDAHDLPADEHGVRTATWPAPLAERLDGAAVVTLREHGSDVVLIECPCSFGSGSGPIDLRDDEGGLLSLSKWGRLNQSFADLDEGSMTWYLDQAQEVLTVLRDELGLPAFVAYGTMLGAARSGRLIGHDMDIDLAYLSPTSTPLEAMLESFAVERHLRDKGWRLRRQNGGFLQLFFEQNDARWRNIDVFTMFVDPSVPRLYGINDIAWDVDSDAVVPLGEIDLEGRRWPAPRQPEVLLEAAYGPSWRVPDPSFEYGMHPGKRQMRQWFGGFREDHDTWVRVYRDQPEIVPRTPTEFAEWVRPSLVDADLVVDAGCGMGRDSLFYSTFSPAVVGLDVAASGVRRATRRARRARVNPTFEAVNFGVLRHSAVAAARLAASYPGRRVVVARHLLDSMSEAARDNFFTFCAGVCRPGGEAIVQFCTDESDRHSAEFPGLPKRPLNVEDAAHRASLSGGALGDVTMFDGPEGESCRVTLTWT